MDIKELREQINEIDEKLVELFLKRMEVSAGVAAYKKERGLPVFDAKRERSHLQELQEHAVPPMDEYVLEFFQDVMRLSRAYQKTQNGRFGLLGEKLGHSYSPQIHEMAAGYRYDLIEVERNQLEAFMKDNEYDGFNVTIPYKKAVIPFLDEISPQAEKIGSVNTVVRLKDGRLRGDNTDYTGFAYMVERAGVPVKDKKCMILGNGGVAPTIRAVLQDMGASEILTVSRKGELNFGNLYDHDDVQILVNATPVGMYPNNGESLADLSKLPALEGVFDVIYNPYRTKLILDAEERGISCSGGLSMLVSQGIVAAERFLDRKIPKERVEEIIGKLESQMMNIALIAMPGAGKTSCGKKLEKLTGRKLVDMDAEIEKKIGCTIPEFFAEKGEDAFRKVETEVLREFSKKSGLIIATGGGVVTRDENYPLLHQNSHIVFLDREDMTQLSKKGRPVSQSTPIEKLIQERMPKYRGWSDLTIRCVNPYKNAKKIIKELKL